ncbi:diphosphomevalonate decarboxylase [Amphibacillus cookii]|uniref:diphosphomevalonate decarboxylase n=1 Tax=Amphibacillus cookii TaxID=767787 RepID=UPI00195E1227|nr:diphosphomevalonate decarboxylase [Amphibacillus cookii]MBM7543090.1 diphosphomevalonate decarboxylase [Amphibacillus cookii]
MKATVRAHTNIALIKYWGKRDENLFLPTNSSLSITLDRFYTETTVHFDHCLSEDVFWLNHVQADQKETKKIRAFLNKVRDLTGEVRSARVESVNHVPTASGFASSASGFAALAGATVKASGVTLSERELSQIARQGSGSACRSIFGGFVEWQKGIATDGSDSYAVQLLDQKAWDLRILAIEVSTEAKKVLSREGMKRTVATSPFYQGWLKATEVDLVTAKKAIAQRSFTLLGETLESNALKMHATTLGADPPFMYWQSSTLIVMETVQALRDKGLEAYFTIDAGPNVKVICKPEVEQKLINELSRLDVVKHIYPCQIGPGLCYLEG